MYLLMPALHRSALQVRYFVPQISDKTTRIFKWMRGCADVLIRRYEMYICCQKGLQKYFPGTTRYWEVGWLGAAGWQVTN
jgi:hypothetical protein